MDDWMLREALGFTDDDLVANRAGTLGPSQLARPAASARRDPRNLVVGGVFVVGLLITVAFILPKYLPQARGVEQYLPVIALVLILIGLDSFLRMMRRRLKASPNQQVLSVEGVVARSTTTPMSGTGVMPTYRMSIGPVTFAFSSPEPLRAFVDGKRYRGYYLGGTSPNLISAEQVS